MARHVKDTLKDIVRYRSLLELPDHSPPSNDFPKLHGVNSLSVTGKQRDRPHHPGTVAAQTGGFPPRNVYVVGPDGQAVKLLEDVM
jgi:hypothetical protein